MAETPAARSLDDLTADLRHAIQFCPRCLPAGFPYYLLCVPHAAVDAGKHPSERKLSWD